MLLSENEWKVINFALGLLAANYGDFEQELLEARLDESCSEANITALADKTENPGLHFAG